jgi:hypothetical protein
VNHFLIFDKNVVESYLVHSFELAVSVQLTKVATTVLAVRQHYALLDWRRLFLSSFVVH